VVNYLPTATVDSTTGAGVFSIGVDAVNSVITSSTGLADIDVAGAFTLDAASILIGGDGDTGAITIGSTSADLTLTTATSGAIYISSVGLKESKAAHGKTAVDSDKGKVLTYNAGALAVAGTSSNFPAGLASTDASSDVIHSSPGEVYTVYTDLDGSTPGAPVYWADAGAVSLTAPSSGNIWRLGYFHSSSGVGVQNSKIVWMPQFIGVA